uniref:TPR_MLP1_2 domain-containing protein n=1 Tax=Rhabditophanes sp. KR3021 TaxID=114890 RepID=A0AC35U3J1_9BILA
MDIDTGTTIEDYSKISDLESQLAASVEQYDRLDAENLKLQKELENVRKVVSDLQGDSQKRGQYVRELENERDTLMVQKTDLAKTIDILDKQNADSINELSKFLDVKQSMQEVIAKLTDDLVSSRSEVGVLKSEITDFKDDNIRNLLERERYENSKLLFTQNKEFLLDEITKKDNNIFDMNNVITKYQLANSLLEDKIKRQNEEAASEKLELSKQLTQQKVLMEQLRKEYQDSLEERFESVGVLEETIKNDQAIIDAYKQAAHGLEKDNEALREINSSLVEQNEELKNTTLNATQYMNKSKQDYDDELKTKDETIALLSEELKKQEELANEQNMSNLSGADLSGIPSAAMETAKILKKTKDLTSMRIELNKVISERDELKQIMSQAQEHIATITTSFDDTVRRLQMQNEDYVETQKANKILRTQLIEADKDYDKAKAAYERLERELKFTNTELGRYQKDNEQLGKQVNRLIFIAEKDKSSYSEDENDEELFADIKSLQDVNSLLRSKLHVLEANRDEEIKKAHDDEAAKLTEHLNKMKQDLEMSEEQLRVAVETLNIIKSDRDRFKELNDKYSESYHNIDIQTVRLQYDDACRKHALATSECERLRELINEIRRLKEEADETNLAKIAQKNEQISSLKETSAKMEVNWHLTEQKFKTLSVQYQNLERLESKNASKYNQLKEERDAFSSELDKRKQELLEAKIKMDTAIFNERKINNSYLELINTETRLKGEIEILRQSSKRNFDMQDTLRQISTRLEKQDNEMGVMDRNLITSLTKQRDDINELYNNVVDHHKKYVNELKLMITRVEGERDALIATCSVSEATIKELNSEVARLKIELTTEARLSNVTGNDATSVEYKPEVRKLNSEKSFLESRLKEYEELLEEYKNKLSRKDQELQQAATFSTSIEHDLIETNVMGEKERTGLSDQISLLQMEVDSLKNIMTKEQENYAEYKSESDKIIEGYRAKIDEIKATLQEKDKQICETEHELAKNKAAISEQEKKIETLVFTNETYENDNSVLNCQKASLEDLTKQLRETITQRQSEIQEKMGELMKIEEEYRCYKVVMERELNHIKHENDTLKERENKVSNDSDCLFTDLKHLIDTFESIVEKNSKLSHSSDISVEETFPETVSKLNSILTYTQAEKRKLIERCSNIECELLMTRATMKNETKKNSGLLSKIITLESEVEHQRKELTQVESLVKKLEDYENNLVVLEECKTELDAKNSQMGDLELRLECANIQIESAGKQNESLLKQIESLTGERDSVKDEINVVSSRLLEAQSNLAKYGPSNSESMLAKIDKLNASLDAEKARANKTRDIAKRYRNSDSEKDNKINALNKQIEEMLVGSLKPESLEKIKTLETRNVELQIQIDNLQVSLSEKEAELEAMQTESKLSPENYDDLKMRMAIFEKMVPQMREDGAKQKETIQVLEETIKGLKSEITALKECQLNDFEEVSESKVLQPSDPAIARQSRKREATESVFDLDDEYDGTNFKKSRSIEGINEDDDIILDLDNDKPEKSFYDEDVECEEVEETEEVEEEIEEVEETEETEEVEGTEPIEETDDGDEIEEISANDDNE